MNELLHEVLHDTLPMIPFLFLTYLLMEYIEHKSNDRFRHILQKTKGLGPLLGAIFGIVPQCGFSVLATGLYMNRSITLGTLLAVFISTSDEAIPILIAQPKQLPTLVNVIIVKILVAILVGYLIDTLIKYKHMRNERPHHDLHEDCKTDKQHVSIGMVALKHTIRIFVFIFIVNLLLTTFIYYVGEDRLSTILVEGSFLQPVLASLVGFIPNCAASVILSQLYLDGVLSFGSLSAGLITSAGLGLLVLLRMDDNKRDVARILGILSLSAILTGILLQAFS